MGLSLSGVDKNIARCDVTFFEKNTGALSAYAKEVLIAKATWATWRSLVILCGPRSRWEKEEVGHATSIQDEKSESGMAAAIGACGADALPWNWKECAFLRVYEAYEFCLMLRATAQ